MERSWQRARKPEQKQQRRREILSAAAALFADRDYDSVSMSAVAERAGCAKGNIYRYFATKEELFLQLYLGGLGAACAQLEQRLDAMDGSGDADQAAQAIAGVFAARPRLLTLQSLLAGVLERNLPPEALTRFKEALLPVLDGLAASLRRAMPGLGQAQSHRFVHLVSALIAGLWPMANPAPDLASILEQSRFRSFQIDFETQLTLAMRHLLRGLENESGST